MIQIDKGIPIPPKGERTTRQKYPFREMEIGDSFHVDPADVASVRSSIRWYVSKHAPPGQKFSVKIIGQDEARCWREK